MISHRPAVLFTLWKRAVLLAFTTYLLAVPCRAQSCNKLTSKTSKADLLAFLDNYANQDPDQDCVAFAIRALRFDRKDERAAQVLVKYLDYFWTEPRCEHVGRPCMSKGYPAAESLMEIGRVSVLYVLNTLKSETTNEISRKNALDVYYYFTRDDVVDGIAFLKREADRTNDPKQKAHLLWAATTEANEWCFRYQKIDRTKCERALKSGVSFVPLEAEYEIYSSAIKKESNGWFFDKYSIAAKTVSSGWDKPASIEKGCEYIERSSEDYAEYAEAFAEFEEKNATIEQLQSKRLSLPRPYMLLKEEQTDQLRRSLPVRHGTAAGTMTARGYIAGSLISVSRIGFSKNGRIAVLYVQHECGPTCVDGGVHVFRHDNDWFEDIVCYR